MSTILHSSLRSQPQDENAMTSLRPGKVGGGLTARGGLGGGTVNKPPAAAPRPAPVGQKVLGGGGLQPASRRALGDITNAGGSSGSGSGGLSGGVLKKAQPVLVASLKPLTASAAPKQSAPKPQKLSAPIQLISAAPLSAASAMGAEDDDDLSWMHVDQSKGDGLGHLRALDHDQDEVAAQASAAFVHALGDGKMFRPNSPIPWERKTDEENNYNALLTAQLPSAADLAAGLAAVDDCDLQF